MARKSWEVSRTLLIVVAIAAVALVAAGTVQTTAGRQSAEDLAREQAGTVSALCARDPVGALEVHADCPRAQRIVQDGTDGEDGADGDRGRAGEDGRGIVRTDIRNDQLFVTYTDGQSVDVGRVVGADGQDGDDGRGIATTAIASGRLVLTYTDGRRVDLGRVVGQDGADGSDGSDGGRGPSGRGVQTVAVEGDRLIITYTDGGRVDAGPLPRGPQGPQGEPGPRCPDGFEVRIGQATVDGTEYGRAALCVDPGSAAGGDAPAPNDETGETS